MGKEESRQRHVIVTPANHEQARLRSVSMEYMTILESVFTEPPSLCRSDEVDVSLHNDERNQ